MRWDQMVPSMRPIAIPNHLPSMFFFNTLYNLARFLFSYASVEREKLGGVKDAGQCEALIS